MTFLATLQAESLQRDLLDSAFRILRESEQETAALERAREVVAQESNTYSSVAPLWNDPRESWMDAGGQQVILPTPPLNPYARSQKRGESLPIYTTEQQLHFLRVASRLLVSQSEYAISAIENRVNYTIGEGLKYKASATGANGDAGLVRDVQAMVDLLCEYNALDEIEREACLRRDTDGDAIIRLFPREDGLIDLRFVEPELLRSPTGGDWSPASSFGIETDPRDVEDVRGYWIIDDPITNQTPSLVPASDVVHLKGNARRSAKRGTPLLYSVERNLRDVEVLLTSLTAMARARAKIALIRKLTGVTRTGAERLASATATTVTTDAAGNVRNIEEFRDGSILTANDRVDYEMPPANTDAAQFVAVADARLRGVAARLNMPEWMLTSNAANMGAYTASLVSEAPSTKMFLRLQQTFRRAFGEGRIGARMSLLWRAVRVWVRLGLLPPNTLTDVRITAEAPTIVTRDRDQEARTNKTYHDLGAKSIETIQQEQGIDATVEAERLKRERPQDDGTSALRGSLAGLQAISGLQTQVYGGQLPRAAAIASVVALFGVARQDAENLFPPDNRPKQDDQGKGNPFASLDLTAATESLARESSVPNKTGNGCHDDQTGHPAPCDSSRGQASVGKSVGVVPLSDKQHTTPRQRRREALHNAKRAASQVMRDLQATLTTKAGASVAATHTAETVAGLMTEAILPTAEEFARAILSRPNDAVLQATGIGWYDASLIASQVLSRLYVWAKSKLGATPATEAIEIPDGVDLEHVAAILAPIFAALGLPAPTADDLEALASGTAKEAVDWQPYTNKDSGRSGWSYKTASGRLLVRYQDNRPGEKSAARSKAIATRKEDKSQRRAAAVSLADRIKANPRDVVESEWSSMAETLAALTVPELRALRQALSSDPTNGVKRDHVEAIARRVSDGKSDGKPTTPTGRDAKTDREPTGQPNTVASIAPSALKVDPERFQYKLGVDKKKGVGDELADVETWNPDLAGVISVWRDPSDGETYVINGHHRHELATRTGADALNVRYLDAKTPEEARAKGAIINIAEGRGTAIDAAKFVRDTGRSMDDLAKAGVSVKGAVARDAAILADLADPLFQRLTTGTLDQARAVAIASHVKDHAKQEALLRIVEKQEDRQRDLSPSVVAEMAREMAATPTTKKTEATLFGDWESEESLFVPRNELKAYIRRELAKEVGDYQALSSDRRAERTAGVGNVLNTEANRTEATRAAQLAESFDRGVNYVGPLSDAINAAAERYAKAKTKTEKERVRTEALEAARKAVSQDRAGRASGMGSGDQAAPPDGRAGAASPAPVERQADAVTPPTTKAKAKAKAKRPAPRRPSSRGQSASVGVVAPSATPDPGEYQGDPRNIVDHAKHEQTRRDALPPATPDEIAAALAAVRQHADADPLLGGIGKFPEAYDAAKASGTFRSPQHFMRSISDAIDQGLLEFRANNDPGFEQTYRPDVGMFAVPHRTDDLAGVATWGRLTPQGTAHLTRAKKG